MKIIGLTGSFGSGKTTIAKLFRKQGAIIIDVDDIVHSLYRPQSPSWKKLKRQFGDGILNNDKTLNRRKLAEIVFFDKRQLRKLCYIIHPAVIRQIKERLKKIKRKSKSALVIIDAPLLFEVGLQKIVDFTICVCLPRHLQVKRLLKNSGFSRRQIEARIRSQLPLGQKKKKSDFVIDNSGPLIKAEKQLTKILKYIKEAGEK